LPRPSFIFIGPSKTGSTWIFELLRSHPQVHVPIAKDIYFFDKFFHKGLAWYEDQFSDCAEHQITGELSHDYFSSKEAIDRIHRLLPEIKLICCLRDPFERALSSFEHFQRNGMGYAGLAVAVKEHPEIFEEGLYFKHLSYIFSKFDRSMISILFFDDLKTDPAAFAQRIFDFLGVDKFYQSPVIGKKINQAGQPRAKIVSRITKEIAVMVRRFGFPSVVGYFKRNHALLRVLYKETDAVYARRLQLNFSQEMICAYNQDLEQLQTLLGQSFSSWKRHP
jgi:hypothetical protein